MIVKRFTRKLFRDAAVIVALSAVAGAAVSLINPRGYVLTGRSALENRKMVFIGPEEAKIKFDGGSAVFIDARERDEYRYSRVRGAMNIPASTASLPGARNDFPVLDRPVELIIYCDGAGCGASEMLAKTLLAKYRRHVYILEAGLPGWESAGYPVERGD